MATDIEVFQSVGRAITDTLNDRWHRKQLEDFQRNELAAYTTQASGLQAQLMREDDPDAMAAIFNNWGKMTSEFITASSGAEYAGNPYIADITQKIFTTTNEGLSNFIQMEGALEERGAEGQARKAGERQRGVAAQEAGTAKDVALGGKYEEEGLLSREKRLHPEKFRAAGAGSKDAQMFLGPAGSPINTWLANMYRPGMTEIRQNQMAEVRRGLAQEELRKLKGQKKPGPLAEIWGSDESDILILEDQVPEDEVRRIWEKQTIERESFAMGHDPAAAVAFFGDRYDQKTPVSKFRPMSGAVSDERIVENLLGPTAAGGLKMSTGVETIEIDQLIKNLPDSIGTLGAGPLQMPFHETLQSGGVVPGLGESVETYQQLTRLLEARGVTLINHHIGGSGVPDSGLDKPTLQARQQARKLYMAMISKYAPQVALGLGIQPPKAEPGVMSLLRESSAVKLLQSGFEGIRGILDNDSDDSITIE